MTWQVGAFAILAVALAGGFAWYERARPDARIVALVATLAAFAALGRIAFAALPNVKPTSDIVLVSGYALGAGPGFVVGALAGLASNFFFGQGPWTPWQMAAWGVTGMLGAWLALATGRRIGRWPLALVCAAAGFAFTVVQDVGDWVTYSDHSLAQLRVYVGKGLGFDAIYAASCFVFALVFGPALTRSIARFATRMHVRWELAVLVVACGGWLASQPGLQGARATATPGVRATATPAARATATPAARATATQARATAARARATGAAAIERVSAIATPTSYLLAAQNSDGGFGPSPGQGSSGLYSGWAALGLAAEGIDPQRVVKRGRSLAGYVESAPGSDPGSLERTVLALRAGGIPAPAEIAALRRDVRGDGSVSEQTNLTAFAALALRSAGVTVPARMMAWLARQQDRDGGFNFATAGGASDVDDTGAVLEALGPSDRRVAVRAAAFVEHQQSHDGGFPSQTGSDSNAQSTAWAVQGLIAAGASGRSVQRAIGYLRSLIAPDGHVRYARGADQTPVWVTAEALMALARKPLPLLAGAAPSASRRPARARPRSAARPRKREIGHTSPRPHPPVASAGPGPADRLAGYVAVADALVLAPLGIG